MQLNDSKPAILGGKALFENRLRLVVPDLPTADELTPGVKQMFKTGSLTKGTFLTRFEAAVSSHSGARHALAVSSCTSGLILSERALELSGEVILPSFTFLASTLGCAWNKTIPVFVDVDPDEWTVDPSAVEAAITPKTSAVLATHLFGNPCKVDELERLASRHGLKLIFDAAHGFGSLYHGRPLGSYGDLEVFSTSPTKLLVTGEGGIITTNNERLVERIEHLREYGNDGSYNLVDAGLNARMPEFSALLGLASLARLEAVVDRRSRVALEIRKGLGDVGGIKWQSVHPENRSSIKDLTVLIDERRFGLTRDILALALDAEGVETRKYYSPPCHQQSYWKGSSRISGQLRVTEHLAASALTIPLYGTMTESEVERLVTAIVRIHESSVAIRGTMTRLSA